ncbi:FAD-binding domain-containing protein [Byssothecium circinans]|uniref:FAD-binding domain-containing protein n=1 Tax=Byssothecium circinans TaxID=147558 RepID=A0A6A5U715_9PLEO|nr:FAD-binding domain-containing protein [Byssothecium circinans]
MAVAILQVIAALLFGFFGTINLTACFQATILDSSGPTLSQDAQIYFPGSEGFANATLRWSAAIKPGFDAIVRVATEEDIQHTIRYANAHNRPFLAISGGHGTNSALNLFQAGIGIWMRGMNGVRIVDDGTAAIIGGGTDSGEVTAALWPQGKQTVALGCDCPGFIAPVLGGGHGWLQGRYGLLADNLISARMVLANGTAITVSETEHVDLFWAIRGAGHNFGIVTSIKYRIYDRNADQDQWAAAGFTFTHDKLEKVFSKANEWLHRPTRPVELTHYPTFVNNPDIDPDMPVIVFWIFWQGDTIPAEYTTPMHALDPVSISTSVTDLAGMNTHLGAAYGLAACQKGYSHLQYPVSLNEWNASNLRAVLEIFSSMPRAFNSSVMLLEAYAMNRVNEIPNDSTAYPDRDGQLLLSPIMTYAANESLDETAVAVSKKIRYTLLNGTGLPLNAYVNYAYGDESLQEIYGHEPWRLEKLRKLKKEYDPHGRFNFYAPIK